ncbi:DUF4908 domain-containing protein [Hyphococcus sp.]|uniref:DUF4908 domain-containing protein n=1 Tax=Hyphococcus sp. TaxID=2038636 RepID=UPI0020860E56|nr:MAG: DUF4908 domain-containing protein [Marinicaulis sp.]
MTGFCVRRISTITLCAALAGVLAHAPAFAGQNQSGPVAADQAPPPIKLAQQADNPFSALVGKRRERVSEYSPARAVERYVLTSDDRVFLFEERGANARVRFLCSPEDTRFDCTIDGVGGSPEIHLLSATRAPRGDVIYKTAEGETLLRIAAYGGATVFWPGETHGIAASKSFGDDRPLSLVFEDYESARRRAQSASVHVGALIGSPIFFDVGAGRRAAGANAAVLCDAVLTAAKGIASVADDPIGARAVADRIKRVAFLPGAAPEVGLNGSILEIVYVPNQDANGRPSSTAVANFLEETL